MSDDVVESTLFICSEIHLYRIPLRSAAGGYRSGEWRLTDEIFKGRLRFVSLGQTSEIRFEDPQSGELFALVPVSLTNRHLVVESTVDSSRNFVVRVQDSETNAHMFLGLGFETCDSAFDFVAALEDDERQVSRQSCSEMGSVPEIDALHRPVVDLGLKEGQTIKVKIKNKVVAPKRTSLGRNPTPKLLAPPSGAVSKTDVQKPDTNWEKFD